MFETWEQVGLIVDATSGVFFVALGLFVGLAGARRRVNIAFAVFAVSLGLNIFFDNLGPGNLGLLPAWGLWLSFLPAIPLFGAMVWLAMLFPRPLRQGEGWSLLVPSVVTGLGILSTLAIDVTRGAGSDPVRFVLQQATRLFVYAGFWFLLTTLAVRHSRTAGPGESRNRRQDVVVSAALLLFLGIRAGIDLSNVPQTDALGVGILVQNAVVVLVLALLWTWNTMLSPPDLRRGPLIVTALAALLPPLGLWFGLATEPGIANNLGPLGTVRILGVLLLAHAILRYQLFGIDLRVKWTIRQSTIAAMFVAVFFAVSELAATLFSGWSGSSYLGIGAAGILVFAMAPLQNFANRVADRAMPDVKPVQDMDARERIAALRAQMEVAWEDGNLTVKERKLLEITRDRLGLTDQDAARLEREILKM